MKQHDLALVLLEKARQDEVAVDRLMHDASISDEIVGFHCQQAAEKLLKALLAETGADVRKTHSLALLVRMLELEGHPIPENCRPLVALTPFAVEFQYGVAPEIDEDPLDRSRTRSLLHDLHSWVESQSAQYY